MSTACPQYMEYMGSDRNGTYLSLSSADPAATNPDTHVGLGNELLQLPGIEFRMADIELYMIGDG